MAERQTGASGENVELEITEACVWEKTGVWWSELQDAAEEWRVVTGSERGDVQRDVQLMCL